MTNSSSSNNRVTKLRASNGTPRGTVNVGGSPEFAAFDGANIWVTNEGSNTVLSDPYFALPATSVDREKSWSGESRLEIPQKWGMTDSGESMQTQRLSNLQNRA